VRCASTGAERREDGLCAGPAYVVIPASQRRCLSPQRGTFAQPPTSHGGVAQRRRCPVDYKKREPRAHGAREGRVRVFLGGALRCLADSESPSQKKKGGGGEKSLWDSLHCTSPSGSRRHRHERLQARSYRQENTRDQAAPRGTKTSPLEQYM
jgi:hypothetical protein